MSDITRRDAVRRLALALTGAGLIDRVAAEEVHAIAAQAAAATGGTYTPKTFTPAQFKALERLADIIIPVENGKPGALAAACPAWIDMISSENDELKASYAKGFGWLDETMKKRGATDFASASAADQIALVDLIAYRKNASPELTPGIEFFALVRRMTVDAFYTSETGIKDIDYRGNSPMGSYPAPTEAIAYALKRSPFGGSAH
jgi:Gluconate 2-dehydrogenase subunit 3